jgi:uncharacterized repeat protein (TIGR02543 family)/uncharacterized protein (TIGR02145 family)
MVKAKKSGFYTAMTGLGIFSASLLIVASAIWLYSPTSKTNAETVTVRGTRSVSYNLALSTAATSEIAITPTNTQTIFSSIDALSIINSCAEGSTVTMSTNSASDNSLTRTGNDSETKTISATTGSNLVNNSWGYSLNNGTNYYPVPVLSSATTVYDSSAAANPDSVNIKFGIKTDNNLPSGSYSNEVLYTLTVKPACLTYTLNWDLDGGTGASGVSYTSSEQNYDSMINLSTYKPTRTGYLFGGWSDGINTFTGDEVSVNINSGDLPSVTLTAIWNPMIQTIVNMQDMTPEVCAATTTPYTTATALDWTGEYADDKNYVPRASLKDSRDGKYYLVSKLADGNCWMSQNLQLILDPNTTLTSDNTDLNSKTSWTPENSTFTTIPNAAVWPNSHPENTVEAFSYYAIASDRYYQGGTGKSSTPTASGVAYDWEKTGAYYNWNAATAGSGSFTMVDGDEAADSICPKGWRIPFGNQADKSWYNLLQTTYNAPATPSMVVNSPINFLYAGYYDFVLANMSNNNGTLGYYWVSTARAQDYVYGLGISQGVLIDINGYNSKGSGLTMRCVAR